MKRETTLEKINSEEHVNEIISRDEENTAGESLPALQLAEELILQLPPDHPGRNRWLTSYGKSDEAKKLQ